jgi:hypothetical protein
MCRYPISIWSVRLPEHDLKEDSDVWRTSWSSLWFAPEKACSAASRIEYLERLLGPMKSLRTISAQGLIYLISCRKEYMVGMGCRIVLRLLKMSSRCFSSRTSGKIRPSRISRVTSTKSFRDAPGALDWSCSTVSGSVKCISSLLPPKILSNVVRMCSV